MGRRSGGFQLGSPAPAEQPSSSDLELYKLLASSIDWTPARGRRRMPFTSLLPEERRDPSSVSGGPKPDRTGRRNFRTEHRETAAAAAPRQWRLCASRVMEEACR